MKEETERNRNKKEGKGKATSFFNRATQLFTRSFIYLLKKNIKNIQKNRYRKEKWHHYIFIDRTKRAVTNKITKRGGSELETMCVCIHACK